MALVHATLEPGARLDLPWNDEFNALVYVLAGAGTVGVDGSRSAWARPRCFGSGDFVTIAASERQDSRTPAMEVLVVGGQPIREPLAWAGPFVMNTKAEVMQALRGLPEGPLRPHPGSLTRWRTGPTESLGRSP